MSQGPHYAAGRYRCEITNHGLTKASTGTVQIVIKFRVLESINPRVPIEQNYERMAFLPVTEKTMEYLIPKLEALGYSRDSIRFLDLDNPQCHDLRGTTAEFFCKHEAGQDGSMRERWDVCTPSAAMELKPPDPQDIRRLDMLFGRARKTGSPASRPKDIPPSSSDEAITDDDVPAWV